MSCATARTATSIEAATVQAREEQHGMCSEVLLPDAQSRVSGRVSFEEW